MYSFSYFFVSPSINQHLQCLSPCKRLRSRSQATPEILLSELQNTKTARRALCLLYSPSTGVSSSKTCNPAFWNHFWIWSKNHISFHRHISCHKSPFYSPSNSYVTSVTVKIKCRGRVRSPSTWWIRVNFCTNYIQLFSIIPDNHLRCWCRDVGTVLPSKYICELYPTRPCWRTGLLWNLR